MRRHHADHGERLAVEGGTRSIRGMSRSYGDAGMVVTNDQNLAKRLRILRVHGAEPHALALLVEVHDGERRDAVPRAAAGQPQAPPRVGAAAGPADRAHEVAALDEDPRRVLVDEEVEAADVRGVRGGRDGARPAQREAARVRDIGVESIQISIYSHRPKVHDAITLVPGSLARSLDAARFLKSQGLRVIFANVLMVQNLQDYQGVRKLAEELGVECTLDPTITPMMDGDRSVLSLGVDQTALRHVFRDQALVGDVEEFCTIAAPADENALSALPCSAGHTACYVSPYGDVFPCVQFPLPTGNVRKERFLDIWLYSQQMNEVRSIRLKDLTTCTSCSHVGSCTRCPGLAFMEGNMRGASSQDCEKSFARTGVPSANMVAKKQASETR